MIENRRGLTIFSHTMLILGIAVILFPLYVAFVAATLDNKSVFETPMTLIPGGHLLENMKTIWMNGVGVNSAPFWLMMLNSFIMAFAITVGKIVVSMLSAFAIVWFRFPLRNLFFWMIFITLMLPVEVRIFPTVEVIANLNMLDSYAGLTLPLMASATATFLFRQFFMTLPDELIEAARIDGASPMRFFRDIVLPLSKTNLAALFVITFIYGWNQYLWPLLIIQDVNLGTAVAGIKGMIATGEGTTQWNQVMAAMLLTLIPPVVIVLAMRARLCAAWSIVRNKMAGLKLQAVSKSWDGKTQVIQPLTLDVADGEFIVMVGPSGCGKSTLLRMVAGLERVTSGDIWIDRKRVTEMEPKDRGIAMVFQNYALYPHMSVEENMAWGLKIRGMGKGLIAERVQEAARILELDGLLKRRPRELSGGQRQRVAMGRAIVRDPAVFLFDEPLSNLDAKLRVQMRLELQQLHRRLKTTSLYVTHDQVEAMTLAQRVMVMNKGVAEQIGTPVEVYEKPASRFVASFIGSPAMNLLEGRISDDGGRFELAGGMQLPTNHEHRRHAGRKMTLGIRPEHFILSSQAQGGIPLLMDTLEILGADNLAHGRWGEQEAGGQTAASAAPGGRQHAMAASAFGTSAPL